MNAENIKDVVRETYGEAALRVQREAVPAVEQLRRSTGAAIPSLRTSTMPRKRCKYQKRRSKRRWVAAIRLRWPN